MAKTAGYYTVDAADSTSGPLTQRTGQRQCERGYYCRMGIRFECPAGYFGSTAGMSNSRCSGPCDAGFWRVVVEKKTAFFKIRKSRKPAFVKLFELQIITFALLDQSKSSFFSLYLYFD